VQINIHCLKTGDVMILKNGKVLLDDFSFAEVDVRIENGKIAEIGKNLSGDEVKDISGLMLLPGLIDEHFHGANGYGTLGATPEDFVKIAEFEATNGVTTITPALSSYPDDIVYSCIEAIKEAMSRDIKGSRLLGLHLEGPFLSEQYRGAHVVANLKNPTVERLSGFLAAAEGCAKVLTVAPELEGAIDTIKYAKSQGLVVEIGHSAATYEEATAAIDAGATISTHTFNAMIPLNHRNPGILGAVLTDDRVRCEVMADLGHVAAPIVKLIYKAKGVDGVNIVSDSTRFAGYPDGEYLEADKKYIIKKGIAYLESGTITGSAYTVFDGVRNCVKELGIPLEDAIKMASYNPAASLGIAHETGSIAEGKRADFFLMTEKFEIKETYCEGRRVY